MKKIVLLATLLFLFNACSSMESAPSAGGGDTSGLNKADVEQAIAMAEKSVKEADAVGGEWRDVKKFIKQAKAAVSKGDLSQAMKLANKADKQAKMGKAQSDSQKNAGPWLF